MKYKLPLTIIFSSLILLAFHFFALRYNLYYTVSWSDTFSHTIGGFIVGAVVSLFNLSIFPKRYQNTKHIILSVLAVGIMWEVFEVSIGMTMVSDPLYPFDTAGDLFYDIFGAYIFTITGLNKNGK